jgi:DNA processing protein
MLKLDPTSPNYPTKLNRLNSPPKTIYIECQDWPALVNLASLAVVGSRRPSPYGQSVCQQITQEVAKRRVVIVSGLALGIDSFAHKATLKAGGKTIAVLPSGFNNIYPSSHRQLAKQIVQSGGALVSTYAPDENIAFKSNFIARNRIIAGMSDALLIPEAAENSGSLHTAKFALDIGIDVLAVPGQITNPTASGSNNLIKSGAQMVTHISDVLDYLNIKSNNLKTSFTASSPEEYIILSSLSKGISDGDELFKLSNLNIGQFNQTLTILELSGKISPLGSNQWQLN